MANWKDVNKTVDADKPTQSPAVQPVDNAGLTPVEWTESPVFKNQAWELTTGVTPLSGSASDITPTPPAPTPTQEGATEANIEHSRVEQAIEQGIEQTETRLDELPTQTQDRIIEEWVQAGEETQQAAEFAGQREDIIQQQDEAIAQTQQQIQDLTTDRAVRDAEALTRVKDAEIKKANLVVEEQRLKNQQAEIEAETKIETAKQQSTWAFNKLGLWFSSGIINEVQRIATNWANELARIKVTWAKHLADSKLEVSKLEFAYTQEINGMVDKYTDLSINNKQSSIQRVSDTQNNLLLNNRQKEEKINGIKDEYKTEKRKLEDGLRSEQERLSDKMINQTKALDSEVRFQQEENMKKSDIQINNWDMSRMLDADIIALEKQSGLPLGTLKQRESTKLNTSFRSIYDNVLWKDYPLRNVNDLIVDARKQMNEGKTMSEAVAFAVDNDLKNNPDFQRKSQIEKAKDLSALSKAQWAGSWGSAGSATQEERDAFLRAGWKSTDLQRLMKTGWLTAATQSLQTQDRANRRADKTLQAKVADTVKDNDWQFWALESNSWAKTALNSMISAYQEWGYTTKEIINELWGVPDLIIKRNTDTDWNVTWISFFNNSDKDKNKLLTIWN